MKALVGAFNQEKALVGAFYVIVQPVVEPMEHYTALTRTPAPVRHGKGLGNVGELRPERLEVLQRDARQRRVKTLGRDRGEVGGQVLHTLDRIIIVMIC